MIYVSYIRYQRYTLILLKDSTMVVNRNVFKKNYEIKLICRIVAKISNFRTRYKTANAINVHILTKIW